MPADQPAYQWIFKYKLYHLPFWMLYHFTWWSIYDGSAINAANNLLIPPYLIKFLFYVVFQAIGVYFCLYYLIPRYLQKGRYGMYLLGVVLTIACIAWVIVGGYYTSAAMFHQDINALFKFHDVTPFYIFKHNTLSSTIAAMTLGMSIKLAKIWMEAQKRQQALEKEKLETELKFLRSQFNPHFLFNTINSIFVLIDKNTTMASESLAKFSGLLRYQLYECNESRIPLDRELNYLESFIELETLRQNEDFEIEVNLPRQGTGNLSIAPFVLMPFIENAFKHVSQGKDQANWIHINLSLEGKTLLFHVQNSKHSYPETSRKVVDYGGLGLNNVQRRLDLLYPDHYQLEIQNHDTQFSVSLKMTLEEQPLPELILKN
ncbi:MAG: histidine kinase [Bacteroidetes bacterium]|nr:histidine kinase [Bacteroidota bacterium]